MANHVQFHNWTWKCKNKLMVITQYTQKATRSKQIIISLRRLLMQTLVLPNKTAFVRYSSVIRGEDLDIMQNRSRIWGLILAICSLQTGNQSSWSNKETYTINLSNVSCRKHIYLPGRWFLPSAKTLCYKSVHKRVQRCLHCTSWAPEYKAIRSQTVKQIQ